MQYQVENSNDTFNRDLDELNELLDDIFADNLTFYVDFEDIESNSKKYI